jgi:hypothetical protein
MAAGVRGTHLFLHGPDGAVPNLFFHALRDVAPPHAMPPYYDHTATAAATNTSSQPAPNPRYLALLSRTPRDANIMSTSQARRCIYPQPS